MLKQGIGNATGKLILMGEHSVVYGEPAIAFPFNGVKVKATIEHSEENQLFSIYHEGLLAASPENLSHLHQLTKRLQTSLHTPNFGLTIESTIPSERGMGSSAAVAVAVTRAFYDWVEVELTRETLLEHVHFSETIAHGNPSGIDAATTSGDDSIYFQRGETPQTFPLDVDAYLLVADTGIYGQTRLAIQSVKNLFEIAPDSTSLHMYELGVLTTKAHDAITSNQPKLLGDFMNQAQTHLHALSVSNKTLDQFLQLAKNEGALGAKLTGGGRGGCFLVLTESKAQAEKIAELLKTNGVKQTWLQGLGAYQHA